MISMFSLPQHYTSYDDYSPLADSVHQETPHRIICVVGDIPLPDDA